jgi:hypothetical protein
MNSELDLTRAVLTAHARSAPISTPVHIMRIAADLRRRRVQTSCVELLNTLHVLREIQPIRNGYWIPAPTSIVTHDAISLAISGCATEELRRHLPVEVSAFGAARLVVGNSDSAIPWLQWTCAPQNSAQWAEREIARCFATATIGVIPDTRFEVYRHWHSSPPRWIDTRSYTGVALSRVRSSLGVFQHYFCELRGGAIRSVADIPQDVDFRFRMQIALSLRSGATAGVISGAAFEEILRKESDADVFLLASANLSDVGCYAAAILEDAVKHLLSLPNVPKRRFVLAAATGPAALPWPMELNALSLQLRLDVANDVTKLRLAAQNVIDASSKGELSPLRRKLLRRLADRIDADGKDSLHAAFFGDTADGWQL